MAQINSFRVRSVKIHLTDDAVLADVEERLKANDFEYKIKAPKYVNSGFDKMSPHMLFPVQYDASRVETVIEAKVYDLEQLKQLGKLFGKKLTDKSTYLHFPTKKANTNSKKIWQSSNEYEPEYPVFIISKGRYARDLSKTGNWLESIGFNDFKVVVEQQEYEQYAERFGEDRVMIIPQYYFEDLNIEFSVRPRKYVFDFCNETGIKKHWCLDDNFDGFSLWNLHTCLELKSLVGMVYLEQLSNTYDKMGLLGFIERKFIPASSLHQRELNQFNTRVFSCILIDNEMLTANGINWRNKYNEDLDLNLQCLTKGICTFRCNQVQINKPTTLSMKGGNTTDCHVNGGIEKRVDYIIEMFPKQCSKSYKKNKTLGCHFIVDYKAFNQRPTGFSFNGKRAGFEYGDYALYLT